MFAILLKIQQFPTEFIFAGDRPVSIATQNLKIFLPQDLWESFLRLHMLLRVFYCYPSLLEHYLAALFGRLGPLLFLSVLVGFSHDL